MHWNALDVVFGLILLFLTIRGLFKGFVGEIFSVGAVVAGIGTAVFFSAALAGPVERVLHLRGWGHPVAFLGLFLAVYIVLKLIEKGVKGIVERINLENLDRALGFFLGFAEGVIVVGLLVFLLRFQTFVDMSKPLSESFVAGMLTPLVAYGAAGLNVRMK